MERGIARDGDRQARWFAGKGLVTSLLEAPLDRITPCGLGWG
jgi:hypothetical protein